MNGCFTPLSLYARDAAFAVLICCQAIFFNSYKRVSCVKCEVDLYLTIDQW